MDLSGQNGSPALATEGFVAAAAGSKRRPGERLTSEVASRRR